MFTLGVKQANGVMCIFISRNDVPIVQGQRCVPERPLIPYRYLEGSTGNFYFFTENGEYPHYSRFGGADVLVYATAEELVELRNGNAG